MTNALSILFCLTLMYLAVTTRLSSYVLILVFQGILVAGVYTVSFFEHFSTAHLVIAGAVLLFRTILIPSYIW
jgi:hydrogenase-4 membrane subunit HyfE